MSPSAGRSAAWRSSVQRRSRARYHSGWGWPALQTVSRLVGAKNVQTTAVANTPSGEPVTNASFIARTNLVWSMKLTNRRMSPRRAAAIVGHGRPVAGHVGQQQPADPAGGAAGGVVDVAAAVGLLERPAVDPGVQAPHLHPPGDRLGAAPDLHALHLLGLVGEGGHGAIVLRPPAGRGGRNPARLRSARRCPRRPARTHLDPMPRIMAAGAPGRTGRVPVGR